MRENVVVVHKESANEREAASECPATAPPFTLVALLFGKFNDLICFMCRTLLFFPNLKTQKKKHQTGYSVGPVSKQVRESDKQRTVHWAPEGRQLATNQERIRRAGSAGTRITGAGKGNTRHTAQPLRAT